MINNIPALEVMKAVIVSFIGLFGIGFVGVYL